MRWTRTLLAAGLTLALVGCAASAPDEEPAGTPTSEATTQAEVPKEVPEGLALTGVIEQDGESRTPYERVTLDPDHPVLTLDQAALAQEILDAGYTPEDAEAVLSLAAPYAVEEGLDSILLEADRGDEWLEANSHRFSTDTQDDIADALTKTERGSTAGGLLDNDLDRWREDNVYRLDYEANQVRVTEFEMQTPARFVVAPNGDLAVEVRGQVQRPAVLTADSEGEKAGVTGEETRCYVQTYSYTKEDGSWLITGWNNRFGYDRTSDTCREVLGEPTETE